MAYNINLSNGQILVTVADGTTNTAASSLVLVGKNYAGYGEFLNENYIRLLENFSNNSAPPAPLQGQIWWNSTSKVLSVYNGTGWKSVSSSTSSATSPQTPIIGDLWWDTGNGQLNVYSGSTWVVIGPAYTATTGQTGAIADIVADSGGGASRVIVKFVVENTTLAVLSKGSAFTTSGLGASFSQINPGFNLASTGSLGYYGLANNASNLGGVAAANYLRSDVASTTNFPLNIANNGGGTPTTDAFRVGVSNDFSVGVTPSAVNVSSTVLGKDLNFYVNVGGVAQKLLALGGSSSGSFIGLTTVDPVVPTGVATKQYVDNTLTGTSSTVLKRDGTNSITGTLLPNANTVNFGSVGAPFNTIFASTFNGNATNSLALGGIAAANYVRNDIAPAPINGNFSVLGTLSVGTSNGFIIDTTPPTTVNLTSSVNGKGINIATFTSGGISQNAITITPNTGLVTVLANPTAALGVATKQYVDAVAGSGSTNLAAVVGNIGPATNNLQDIGSTSFKWRNVYATTFVGNATTANYADIAERFHADQAYAPGTVMELGGAEEITAAVDALSDNVFGVVSTQAAYLMNAGAGTDATHPPIAMQGRVPVRVIGTVQKGDRLVSAGNGLARAAGLGEYTPFNVIGRALESKSTSGEGTIEAIVKLNS